MTTTIFLNSGANLGRLIECIWILMGIQFKTLLGMKIIQLLKQLLTVTELCHFRWILGTKFLKSGVGLLKTSCPLILMLLPLILELLMQPRGKYCSPQRMEFIPAIAEVLHIATFGDSVILIGL